MNGNTQVNTFTGGMNMDLDYSLLKDNQYIYAENVRVVTNDDNSFGVAQTIEGFDLVHPSIFLDAGERIIHTDVIRDYGVVFTELNGINNIYRFDFSQTELEPQVTKVISLALDIAEPVSSVCRWESSDNIKVYWADGEHQIRVVNIAPSHDTKNEYINPDELDVVPNSTLPALTFKGYGGGSLKAGKIQYAYQLFNVRGTETGLSSLTGLIRLSKSDVNNPAVVGTVAGDTSGKSVKLEAVLDEVTFTNARIIALHYSSNNELPDIYVVDEISLNGNYFEYEDFGTTRLNELTISEFNALVSYTFVPKVIETKDNILFAANVTESTWDVEYDARAYRCDSEGWVMLKSNSGNDISFHIDNINETVVDETHDCINPYNTDDTQLYKYTRNSSGASLLGGKGRNVSYYFVNANFIEDNTTSDRGYLQHSKSLESVTTTLDSIYLYRADSGSPLVALTVDLPERTRYSLSYGDPTMDNMFRGYQRDEVYRFGVVFYNEKNIASAVHWIADIRMPKVHESKVFTSGGRVDLTNGTSYTNVALVTHPMGVAFTVDNIPPGVTGFEIVRCDRTLADRSIVSQGVLSRVAREKSLSTSSSSSNIKPYPFLTYNDPKYVGYNTAPSLNDTETKDTHYFDQMRLGSGPITTSVNNIFNFVCPEVAINRENIELAITNVTELEDVARLFSMIEPIDSDASADGFLGRTFVNLQSNINNFTDGILRRFDGYYNPVDFVSLTSNSDNESAGVTWESQTLGKYYNSFSYQTNKKAGVQDIKYAASLDWNQFENAIALSSATSIGGYAYSNIIDQWLIDSGIGSNHYKRGLYGPTLLLRIDDITNIPTTDKLNIEFDYYLKHAATSVALCNLRKPSSMYGGSTYTSRQNSVYTGIGTYHKSEDSGTTFACFGGDTYIGVLDYAVSTQFYFIEDYNKERYSKHVHSVYIPVETTINLLQRSDDFRMSRNFNPAMQNNIAAIGNIYSQDKPMYAYNDVHSLSNSAKQYVAKGLYNIDNLQSDARVMHSQPKTDNEVSDSWAKFLVANFLDVDNQYGSINQLVNFRNTLFFWQTDAFGTLAVNERSLISDNNPGALTLGTGDILTRYDYVSNKNGLKQDYLRSVTKSDSALYWYDYDRSEICGFQGDLQTVSKIKGAQSYVNEGKLAFKKNPNFVYDKKYNEALLTLDNKTLAYNEQIGAFTSFYTISPDWYFEFTDKLYTFKDNNLFKYNSGDIKNLYGTDDKWTKLVMVINKDYTNTKTFDNIQYAGDFTWGTNLTNIVFNTKRQESFVTTMDKIDYREDTYKFAIPRSNREFNEIQELVNKSYRDRMKGKYMVATYYYNNNNGNTFKLPYVSTLYRYSMI